MLPKIFDMLFMLIAQSGSGQDTSKIADENFHQALQDQIPDSNFMVIGQIYNISHVLRWRKQ